MYKRIAISILVSLIGLTLLLTPLQAKRSGDIYYQDQVPSLCIIISMTRIQAPARSQATLISKSASSHCLAKAIILFL